VTERYICIHGHFYQPPRENPWLEEVEREESAHPFHDWNERITHECYAPNAFARILDDRGRIARIVNNYGRLSFNFGPTLLTWLERKAPETYQAILTADRESRERFSGHGSAMAQAYNHMIVPLANSRDRRTQIRWGIRDFQHRFGREPEGMWLPETAVDLESLELLAAEGIRFTVLAPHQAEAIREPGGKWREVGEEELDTSVPYRISLPSGTDIAVFFYHGPVSRAVAFERLLADGAGFADRLLAAAREHEEGGLTHIATDGETYGHHHRHGEMALSFALQRIEETEGAHLTNYGEYLERHPPEREIRIREHSSWSCAHGTERWKGDCGCSTGAHPEWSQAWRTPVREALDRLRDRLTPLYEEAAGELTGDPWGVRDRYIEVILNRDRERVEAFLEREAVRPLADGERTRLLELLELQRHAQLMYTSCGWFFDDVSGIESLQVLKYASRALHLAGILFGDDLEEGFKEDLAGARSNLPAAGSGRDLYEARVQPLRVGLHKVAAHHAVSTLFDDEVPEKRPVYCYTVTTRDEVRRTSGGARLALGHLEVSSRITLGRTEVSSAVLHMGDHNLVGGVRPYRGQDAYRDLMEALLQEFDEGSFPELIRLLDREFQAATYSLGSLFRDEQEKVLGRILEAPLQDAERTLSELYASRAPLMRLLAELDIAQPAPFRTAGQFTLNTRLQRALSGPEPDVAAAEDLLEEARRNGLELDEEALDYTVGTAMHRVLERLGTDPEEPQRLRAAEQMAELVEALPFQPDLWWAQNTYFRMLDETYPRFLEGSLQGDPEAEEWVRGFQRIGELLSVAVPDHAGSPTGSHVD